MTLESSDLPLTPGAPIEYADLFDSSLDEIPRFNRGQALIDSGWFVTREEPSPQTQMDLLRTAWHHIDEGFYPSAESNARKGVERMNSVTGAEILHRNYFLEDRGVPDGQKQGLRYVVRNRNHLLHIQWYSGDTHPAIDNDIFEVYLASGMDPTYTDTDVRWLSMWRAEWPMYKLDNDWVAKGMKRFLLHADPGPHTDIQMTDEVLTSILNSLLGTMWYALQDDEPGPVDIV